MCSFFLKSSLIILLVASFCDAQEMAIGSLNLRLGQEKSAVMREIDKRGLKLITPKTNSATDESFLFSDGVKILGQIRFMSGKLVSIGRSWGEYEGEAVCTESANALVAAIESATSAEGTEAIISTKTVRLNDDNTVVKLLTLSIGKREVTVISSSGKLVGGSKVSIDERVSIDNAKSNTDTSNQKQ